MNHTNNKECDVLITYCWNRVGYNILRSLSNQGLKVWVADTSEYNICSMSKYKTGSFVYPDPFTQEEEFINCLLEHIQKLKPQVLLPTHDESVVIAKNIDKFPKDLIIPIANLELLTNLSNKKKATELAESIGVPVPEVYQCASDAKFPCVFKTAIGNSAKTVFYPQNKAELEELISTYKDTDILIEEFVTGIDYCVDCVRQDNQCYTSVYKALVTKTPNGGTTTQREIVECPQLEVYAKKMLDAVNYNGVCGIDFKYNETTQRAAFIEVNARYTGGIATPIVAGFDIPYLHYCLSTEKKYPYPIKSQTGIKTKWILGDIITLAGMIVSGPFTMKKFKQLLSFNFDGFDDFKKDDPWAIWGELSYYFVKLIKNRKLNP